MTLHEVQPDGRVRELRFVPGYDERARPGNYGIHGMELHFMLRDRGASLSEPWAKPRFAVYFEAYTNWMPSSVEQNWKMAGTTVFSTAGTEAYGSQVGYHSTVQLDEDQYSHESCDWLNGQRCFCGSSGLDARQLFVDFANGGDEAVWLELNHRADLLAAEIEQALSDARNFS